MSRCFPFPPPGYENKARIEDLDLLKKDDHKKKRKKEKRDHKEKRKSRKRDKRDREKDRVKDKARTLDESKLSDKIQCHNRQFLIQKDLKNKDNCRLTEKRYPGHSAGYSEEKSSYGGHLPERFSASEIDPELPKRIKDGDSGLRNLLGEKLSACLPETDDWMDRTMAKVTHNFDEGKMKNDHKENHEEKYGDRGLWEGSKFSRRGTIQPMAKDGVDSVEKNAGARTEEKMWKGNGRDEKSKEKQKDKDKEGKGKHKERDKKKKKEKIGNMEKSKERYEGDVTSPDSIITSQHLRDSHRSVASVGSLMKRKDFETNGIFAKDHMSSNFAKFTSSDLPRVNHKMLQSCQSSLPAASNWQVQSEPPHPDLEYLSQVYLVPKMEEWSDFCDQEWLYSSNASKLKMLKAHEFEMEMTTPYVWAEAMQIDSIDICALPYVVPY
ncbi:splicing regulatory glutamine/lysine-rich protein 1-like [Benincasa hispida]|uniref:splicing regulatory glutamine/lysine-rich protein 1-like n=1 Tax=Benincasa hispida TaxID=102211 RepID=UPI0019026101|nr:splicing regulatory glutamine/lysine-rich protein 1-like [Benincasa hispida]